MKLKCEKCGSEMEFANHKDAFKEGWDFPPMCPVTTCGNCPSAPLVLKKLDTVQNPNPSSKFKKS